MAAAAEITMVKTRMRMPSDSSRVNGKTLARSEQRKLTPMQLVDRMSKAPAEIYGLTDRAVQAGNFARLVLLDWDTEKVYETYKSKGINTPYTGKKLTGSPKAIVTGTKVTE